MLAIINKDTNLSYRNYKHLNDDLLVTSIFTTIQGEGPYAGRPAVFLRLAGCNIGAKDMCGFCDTKFDFAEGTRYSVPRLAAELSMALLEIATPNLEPLLVITGGEPLLQQSALQSLVDSLPTHTVVQVETNGMLLDGSSPKNLHYVISPKATSQRYIMPDVEATQARRACLKFVVSADPSSIYHDPLSNLPVGLQDTHVYISAMCVYKRAPSVGEVPNIWDNTLVDIEATAQNYKYAAQYALKHRCMLSYQTHLFGALA